MGFDDNRARMRRLLGHSLDSLRILIVEDQQDLSQVWADFLRHMGHEVALATSLAEASDVLASGLDPQVAIVDWTLRDGLADPLIETLRAQFSDCVVFVTTGHGQEVTEVTKDRVAGFLRKPFSLRDLNKLITSPQS